jgi:hypothetical protein
MALDRRCYGATRDLAAGTSKPLGPMTPGFLGPLETTGRRVELPVRRRADPRWVEGQGRGLSSQSGTGRETGQGRGFRSKSAIEHWAVSCPTLALLLTNCTKQPIASIDGQLDKGALPGATER